MLQAAAIPPSVNTEPAAAILQAAVTLALAGLSGALWARYRKPYLAWWTAAWALYLLRIGAILSFLTTESRIWLYWHQVFTGWTALALLAGALVFSRQRHWRPWYAVLLLFPPLWSWVAIYRLDVFLLAAGPTVLFLSLATLWTGTVLWRYRRRVGSSGAALLAGAFFLWGLHHLDYPFLRPRGLWNPWGYYLDILFELAVGAGIVLLVLDELQRGLAALSAVSRDLQTSGGRGGPAGEDDVLDVLLARPLTLPAVRGSALYLADGDGGGRPGGRFVRGAGLCAAWSGTAPADGPAEAIAAAVRTGRPQTAAPAGHAYAAARAAGYAYAAALPVYYGDAVGGALVLIGEAHDPFTALDDAFLVALGQQVGAALERADLRRRLEARTTELERLSARMVEQHEGERRRLSRELHDETAQVFSAVKMELGVLRDVLPSANGGADLRRRFDHVLGLVDTGIGSIRRVVNDLRPSLLDDLGLLPALRSLVAEFRDRSGLAVTLDASPALPPLSADAELALFRALQEALSNVARHAGARRVSVAVGVEGPEIVLRVTDDGRGLPGDAGRDLAETLARFEREGHMGLAGMRERLAALGGTLRCGPADSDTGRGVRLEIRLPFTPSPA